MSDLISKADVLEMLDKRLSELDGLYLDGNPDALIKWYGVNWARMKIGDMPSAQPDIEEQLETAYAHGYTEAESHFHQVMEEQPEIIYCKDCKKHNKKIGFDKEGNVTWREDACPLVHWRGKAQGHEFDYQYCAMAERRQDE